MAATYTPVLGTSNVRGSSRQTRTNPARTSKTNGSNLRQNSLISIQPPSVHGGPEPHGFYPAIQHFTDAISAFPREYRRHTSLLKEVDAKAWQPEENLQILLSKCLADQPTSPPPPVLPSSAAPSITHPADDAAQASAANSVAGLAADAASQISSASSTSLQRRQLFGALRHNLFQIMVTMDEKNHVINNANEELSTHIRRLDNVWPHLADEISEEARLGSLRHWALTDMNPTKKSAGSTSRLDTNMAIMPSNELARRSESRREAVAAKTKQRLNRLAQLDSGTEVKNPKKKALAREDRANDSASDVAGLGISTAKGKKGAKTGGAAMEKSLSAALGGRAMSREPSQQDGSKKRKAPASGAAVARKRINAAADSPKLASSPLASSFPKDAYKRSPALAAARPVSARARPNSSQVETSRTKSSAAQRSATSTGTAGRTAAGSSKTATEDKTYPAAQGDQQGLDALEAQHHQTQRADGPVSKGIARTQQLAERRASKTRDADTASARGANSPRLATLDTERGSRGRASKTSTPIVGTFSEAEFANAVSANGDTTSGAGNSKAKRPARPRPKYDGLHDSLSPKGLPPKRLHKKNGSVATLPGSQGSSAPARLKEEASMDGRLQRSNSGNTAMSGSGNATPNDMEGSDDDDVNDGQRQSSQPRGSRGRGRSQQNSRKGTNGGSRDTGRGRAVDADPGAEDGDVDVDGEAELGPAAQPVASRRNTMPDPDVDMNDGDAEVDADPDADADAEAEQDAEDADPDPDVDADPDDTAELDPDATDPANDNDNDNDAGVDADADADAGDDDEDDIRYCYCQMRSYGAMVACDNDDCPIQWFHLGCSGLKSLPRDNAEWYCKECREQFVGAAA